MTKAGRDIKRKLAVFRYTEESGTYHSVNRGRAGHSVTTKWTGTDANHGAPKRHYSSDEILA